MPATIRGQIAELEKPEVEGKESRCRPLSLLRCGSRDLAEGHVNVTSDVPTRSLRPSPS